MPDQPASIKKYLAIRKRLKTQVYDEIYLEAEKLFAANPGMTKLKETIYKRLEIIDNYDEAAFFAIAEFYPAIKDTLKVIDEPETDKPVTFSIEDLKKQYE
jgi:hypothetical protein